jgi:hypothetical protein
MQTSILLTAPAEPVLLKRTLWAIATRGPQAPFEVLIAGHPELARVARRFSSCFPWKLLVPGQEGKRAYEYATGELFFEQDGSVIPLPGCYEQLTADLGQAPFVAATVNAIPRRVLEVLDDHGSNLSPRFIADCEAHPRQTDLYRSLDRWAYLTLCRRELWTMGYAAEAIVSQGTALCQGEPTPGPWRQPVGQVIRNGDMP